MKFTAAQLDMAIRQAGLTKIALADLAGVDRRTLGRFTSNPETYKPHVGTMEAIYSALLRHGVEVDTIGIPKAPLVVVPLPPERVATLGDHFLNLKALADIWRETQTHECVLHQLRQVTDLRSEVFERDGDLYFSHISGRPPFIRSGDARSRVSEIGDRDVGKSSAERNWKSILTREPGFYFIQRSYPETHFAILTVPTRRAGSNQHSQTVSTAIRGVPFLGEPRVERP